MPYWASKAGQPGATREELIIPNPRLWCLTWAVWFTACTTGPVGVQLAGTWTGAADGVELTLTVAGVDCMFLCGGGASANWAYQAAGESGSVSGTFVFTDDRYDDGGLPVGSEATFRLNDGPGGLSFVLTVVPESETMLIGRLQQTTQTSLQIGRFSLPISLERA